jgi:CRISPR-associated protein Csx17
MTWNLIPLPGIRADSLGGYLTALGLLSATSQNSEWIEIRGSWRDGHFLLQCRACSFNSGCLKNWLLTKWQPRPFEKWWGKTQTESKENPDAVAKARASETDERVDELDMVMIQSRRRVFNDFLGTGGNIGKRNLASVWKTCWTIRTKDKTGEWLDQTLFGIDDAELPELNSAGTWFVASNKTFNSGQNWYREGRLSPWSFLLAMEGVRLMRGGLHRRHGARISGKAVFPFMCRPSSPPRAGLIAHGKSEFWAPLWNKPATLSEIESLFRSGLAEIGGRPVTAPHEFAVAAIGAGVDSGITAFVPFELRQTTSAQVFEAIPRTPVNVERTERSQRASELLSSLIRSGWLDRLPREPTDAKQRGKFVGLRGPVEASILRISEQPNNEQAWQSLLFLLARTQEQIDRNKSMREQCIPLPPLSAKWFDMAWPHLPAELRIARAIASIGRVAAPRSSKNETNYPISMNIFGIERSGLHSFKFPVARPLKAVWHNTHPLQVLIKVLQRRLIDSDELAATPLDAANPCALDDVGVFLDGPSQIDDELIARWIPALSLLAWPQQRMSSEPVEWAPHPLYTLFRPILDSTSIIVDKRSLFPLEERDSRKPHAASARQLVNLILQNDLEQAVQVARRRYLAVGWRTFDPPMRDVQCESERLAAALLIPANPQELSRTLADHWLISCKN